MKTRFMLGYLILTLSTSLIGCGPAVLPSNTFAGTWTTNLGIVNFVQSGDKVTGIIDGYGGFWNETFSGTISKNGETVFDTELLGGFTLVLDGQGAFKSTSPDLSFCGVRGADAELPAGCGFSGKWIATSGFDANEGHLILTQTGGNVTGGIYNSLGEKYQTFNGTVDWGKGWRANGTTSLNGDLSLWINASETGFELIYGDGGNPQKLCAIRDGISSAYLSSYYCEP
jgi:hypothetical protein